MRINRQIQNFQAIVQRKQMLIFKKTILHIFFVLFKYTVWCKWKEFIHHFIKSIVEKKPATGM